MLNEPLRAKPAMSISGIFLFSIFFPLLLFSTAQVSAENITSPSSDFVYNHSEYSSLVTPENAVDQDETVFGEARFKAKACESAGTCSNFTFFTIEYTLNFTQTADWVNLSIIAKTFNGDEFGGDPANLNYKIIVNDHLDSHEILNETTTQGNSDDPHVTLDSGPFQVRLNGTIAVTFHMEHNSTNSISDTANWNIREIRSEAHVADSDGDGVLDSQDQCEGHDDNIDVDSDGTPDGCDSLIDSDGDEIADDSDNCPNTEEGTTVDEFGCPVVVIDDPDNSTTNQSNNGSTTQTNQTNQNPDGDEFGNSSSNQTVGGDETGDNSSNQTNNQTGDTGGWLDHKLESIQEAFKLTNALIGLIGLIVLIVFRYVSEEDDKKKEEIFEEIEQSYASGKIRSQEKEELRTRLVGTSARITRRMVYRRLYHLKKVQNHFEVGKISQKSRDFWLARLGGFVLPYNQIVMWVLNIKLRFSPRIKQNKTTNSRKEEYSDEIAEYIERVNRFEGQLTELTKNEDWRDIYKAERNKHAIRDIRTLSEKILEERLHNYAQNATHDTYEKKISKAKNLGDFITLVKQTKTLSKEGIGHAETIRNSGNVATHETSERTKEEYKINLMAFVSILEEHYKDHQS